MTDRVRTDRFWMRMAICALVASFFVIFSWHGGWQNGQAPSDDPTYIEKALATWSKGQPADIEFSPLHVDLMAAFVGTLGPETGYKIFRACLLLAASLLLFLHLELFLKSFLVRFAAAV